MPSTVVNFRNFCGSDFLPNSTISKLTHFSEGYQVIHKSVYLTVCRWAGQSRVRWAGPPWREEFLFLLNIEKNSMKAILEAVCEAFRANHIAGAFLSRLDDSDWKQLIPNLGFRVAIREEVTR
jgi:hypothetical protein